MASQPAGIAGEDAQMLLQLLTALRDGNFCEKLPEGQAGTMGEITPVVNALVDQLNELAHGVTVVAREIGSQGRFGVRAETAAPGTWRDLVDNVNFMAACLTDQVRDFEQVTAGYAAGDTAWRATVRCEGETRQLRENINRLGARMSARQGPG